MLNWSTASENNNKGFYLEKSLDGVNFQPLTFVNGRGTSVITQSYNYNDFDISSGTLYYRLKQVDFDGHFTYSRVVILQSAKEALVRVMPNPFKSYVQVYLGESASKIQAQLYDQGGHKLYDKNVQLNGQSSLNLKFNEVNLPKGIYILTLLYNDKKKQFTLMKE